MDTFLKKIEWLAEMARREASPVPLDAPRIAGIMAGIRGLEIAEPEPLPLVFFAGGAAAAAAAAVFVTLLAFSAWGDMSSPYNLLMSLPEALELPL